MMSAFTVMQAFRAYKDGTLVVFDVVTIAIGKTGRA
jgi:hypothetical protein